MRPRARQRLLALGWIAALALAGCGSASAPGPASPAASGASGSASPAASGSTTNEKRPSSTAQLSIISPTPNESVSGPTVHIVISLTGAKIVAATTTNVRPDEGHIHLYVDNNLVSMNYATTADLPAVPGTHVLRAEFVASDHVPFNPRVVTSNVIFTVKP
jgi:hypothetical protein